MAPASPAAPSTRVAQPTVPERQQQQADEERRVDADGVAYTRTEFLDYYGGLTEWNRASPALDGVDSSSSSSTAQPSVVDYHASIAAQASAPVSMSPATGGQGGGASIRGLPTVPGVTTTTTTTAGAVLGFLDASLVFREGVLSPATEAATDRAHREQLGAVGAAASYTFEVAVRQCNDINNWCVLGPRDETRVWAPKIWDVIVVAVTLVVVGGRPLCTIDSSPPLDAPDSLCPCFPRRHNVPAHRPLVVCPTPSPSDWVVNILQ